MRDPARTMKGTRVASCRDRRRRMKPVIDCKTASEGSYGRTDSKREHGTTQVEPDTKHGHRLELQAAAD